MQIPRRSILVGMLTAPFVLIRKVRADELLFSGAPPESEPGDYGYKHDLYHDAYQKLFGQSGRCLCGDGECRVTDWRTTSLGSPRGYDVIAYRRWWPLLSTTWMPSDPQTIPPELFNERAHICAYGDPDKPSISCALINSTQA